MQKTILDGYSLIQSQAIQWGEMDSFQHVNNSVYFRYFENARIAYFDLAGINEYMAKNQVGPILGSTECKFLVPLTYPDKITIATRISAIREKRFTMNYLVYSESHTREAAVGSGEIIFFDYQNKVTCPIPERILENINQVEQRAQVKNQVQELF
jgi:acyl-CoA thioester hydrolase